MVLLLTFNLLFSSVLSLIYINILYKMASENNLSKTSECQMTLCSPIKPMNVLRLHPSTLREIKAPNSNRKNGYDCVLGQDGYEFSLLVVIPVLV